MRIIHLCFSTNVALNNALSAEGFELTRVDYAIPWRSALLAAAIRQPSPDALVASWPPGIGSLELSERTDEPVGLLNPADYDAGEKTLVAWLREQPNTWLTADGRRWNAIPFAVVLSRHFELPFARLSSDPAVLSWPEGGGGEGAQEAAVQLRTIIETYWRALLSELDQCGYLIRYDNGGLVVTPAFNAATDSSELKYHSGEAASLARFLTIPPCATDYAGDVEAFEKLIGDPRVTESALQQFLETHPSFLSERGTLKPLSHPRLIATTGRVLVPDFLLRPRALHHRDDRWKVLDLKLPATPLLVGARERRRLSAEIHSAIRQLVDYGEFFAEPSNAARVNEVTGYSIRFPRLAVLVGRTPLGDDARALSHEQSRYPHVALVTYDEVLSDQRSSSAYLE